MKKFRIIFHEVFYPKEYEIKNLEIYASDKYNLEIYLREKYPDKHILLIKEIN
jgi:hypothetical protein